MKKTSPGQPGLEKGISRTKRKYNRVSKDCPYWGPLDQIIEIEQIVLGTILWEPNKLNEAKAIMTPKNFRYEKHQIIYSAMLDIDESRRDLDVCSLCEQLQEQGELDSVGGSLYITYLTTIVIGEKVSSDLRNTNDILKSLVESREDNANAV